MSGVGADSGSGAICQDPRASMSLTSRQSIRFGGSTSVTRETAVYESFHQAKVMS